jgi:ATP-dependent 26S proteasome regulatory subunit
MNVDPDVNYDELARCTDDFNGAQCKAVCVEAGASKSVFRIRINFFRIRIQRLRLETNTDPDP